MMIEQKIKDKRDELEKFRRQHPEAARDISKLSEDEMKFYFKLRTELASLLFEQNQQIIKAHTINITIPDDHTTVRRLIVSQDMIFDANCGEIQITAEAFYYIINKIEKENVTLSKAINSKEMNDFCKILYETLELKKLIEDDIFKTTLEKIREAQNGKRI